MWANVLDGVIVKTLSRAKPVTVGNVNHPSTIFRYWSEAELNNIGWYTVVKASKPSSKYHRVGSNGLVFANGTVTNSYTSTPKVLEDVVEVVEGVTVTDDRGDPRINEGLKSQYITKIKAVAAGMLQVHDWQVIRGIEDTGKPVKTSLANYRKEVRTISNFIEGQINACVSIGDLVELDAATTANNFIAPINNWPDAYTFGITL